MIRIVLVRPAGPRNVGSVLRAAANFGPAELVLVAPVRPAVLLHPDFEQMAHGVPELAERVRVVATLEEALSDATACYGFTARARDHHALVDWRAARDEVSRRARTEGEVCALVFGNEETGLTGADCRLVHTLIRIPVSDEHGSLNLAMAVAVVLSQLFLDHAPPAEAESSKPLPVADRAFLVSVLQEALGGRTTSAPARRDLVASIERVFLRAPLETRDARAWHLLARALGTRRRPQDFGLSPHGAPDRVRSAGAEEGGR